MASAIVREIVERRLHKVAPEVPRISAETFAQASRQKFGPRVSDE